jgi:hypothetical protein
VVSLSRRAVAGGHALGSGLLSEHPVAMVEHHCEVNSEDRDRLMSMRARVALLLSEGGHSDVYRRWLLGFAHALESLVLAGEPLSARNRDCLRRLSARLEASDRVRN